MTEFWPFQPDSNPMAASLNSTPKYVASRTLGGPLGWKGAELLDGELVGAVTGLKNAAGGGDVVVLGSGTVVRQLMEADLVDELRLFVHPLVLGSGKRLFGELPAPRPLRLIRSAATSKGAVALTYAVEGPTRA